MPLYTAIIEHSECEHCEGIGRIIEYVECPHCEGEGMVEVAYDEWETCDKCIAGEMEVSDTPCRFCDAGNVYQIIYQFDCRDIDVCVALLKGKLAQEKGYIEEEFEFDEPTLLDDRENVWCVTLSDERQQFWSYIIETARAA